MFKPKSIQNLNNYQCFLNHNLPISAVNLQPGLTNDQRFACRDCLEVIDLHVTPLKKVIQEIEQPIKQRLFQYESIITPHLDLLKQFYGKISIMESFLLQQLDQITTLVNDWITSIKQIGEQIANYNFFDKIEELIYKHEPNQDIDDKFDDSNLMALNENWYKLLNSQLDQFKYFKGYDKCQEILLAITKLKYKPSIQQQELSEQLSQQQSNYSQFQLNRDNSSFEYNIIPQLTYEQGEQCKAIAINYNNTLIAIASDCDINILKINTSLNQIKYPVFVQRFEREHSDHVTTLKFFKKEPKINKIISGSLDSTIIIWAPQKKLNNWNALFKFKNHIYAVNCLLISSSSEDLFVSGSSDKTIKFWSLNTVNSWSCYQTIKEHTSYVYGLAMNDDGNKVLSWGNDDFILVIDGSNKQLWQVKQKIYNDGIGISFITNSIFACQSKSGTFVSIYVFRSTKDIYIKQKTLPIQTGGKGNSIYFPMVYNSSKKILLSKNGHNLNLIKLNFNSLSECEIIDEYVLFFIQNSIYGTLSDDGNLLITWDSKSREIQFRKFMKKGTV